MALATGWGKKRLLPSGVVITDVIRDEIMYHARIHPEQYSNTLTDAQLRQLHTSLLYVCSTAVDLLADSTKFPENWLFKHRWGKGKKDQKKELPNGDKIVYITVGGRTSAVVPSVQKKTGPVAGDVKSEEVSEDVTPEEEDEGVQKPGKQMTRPSKAAPKATSKAALKHEGQQAEAKTSTRATNGSRSKKAEKAPNDPVKDSAKKRKAASLSDTNTPVKDTKAKKAKSQSKRSGADNEEGASGRRRSTRVATKAA